MYTQYLVYISKLKTVGLLLKVISVIKLEMFIVYRTDVYMEKVIKIKEGSLEFDY